jgi:hypothetical protein
LTNLKESDGAKAGGNGAFFIRINAAGGGRAAADILLNIGAPLRTPLAGPRDLIWLNTAARRMAHADF